MGKQRYLLWVVCSLATLASCSRDDEMPADNAIRFENRIGEPYVDGATRGAVTDDANFAEFGVFAYYAAPGDAYNASTSTPDYMYNVHVTRPAGESWTYAPLKFWPQGSVSFFAYSPYNTDTEASVACTTGAPVVTYAVPNEVADHRDLLLSAPALDKTQINSPVMLTFHHALACIDFKARVDGALIAGESIKVAAIRLGDFKHKASCHHELEDAITPTFTADAADKAYSLSVVGASLADLPLTTTDQQITSANGCPMLWPQDIDPTDTLTVTAEYISNSRTRTIVFEQNMKQFVSTMEAGKRYIFTLLFNPFGSMELTCTVVDWYTKIIDVPDFD